MCPVKGNQLLDLPAMGERRHNWGVISDGRFKGSAQGQGSQKESSPQSIIGIAQ